MPNCPDPIKQLVEHFDRQADLVRAPDYNETQLRIDFINPMFQCLGWDIDNSQRFAEQYREVVHEDRVKIAGQTKAPDYSFRVGGLRKFFLEAKKPFVTLKTDWEPAYQLRRYGWSAKLPLSILSNFAELAVYDCRLAPKYLDAASRARREYITYQNYIERWDFIEGTFSKRAVLQGDFDRYAQADKGRGKEEFDEKFLEEIEEWRKELAANLALRNERLDQSGLNFAVQRIIDRIIFLRMAEDRGTESPGQLHALLNGTSTYGRLRELFADADKRYNSGLFHFDAEKGRDEAPDTLTPSLAIDDAALKGIIKRLYYPESPYEFTVVSADILGSVYERFLGKVITLTTGHRAKIEEKPEVRKAGGVYYTPTYIVDYIVKNTVGKLLGEPPSGADALVGSPASALDQPPSPISLTPKQAAKLKILDPACGSGSFLIGAYQFLLDWHLAQYIAQDPAKLATGKNAVIRPGATGDWRLTIAERKRILLDNIHGVDLDGAAVEVTKLNLLLKCLEGETSATLGFQGRLFKERALPDLGRNILCGNSLIGTDIIDTPAWTQMTQEERQRINPFDYDRAFNTVFKQGGFNAVIGNPPYVRSITLKEADETAWALYKNGFLSASEGEWDLYLLFAERALSLLNSSGQVGLILPNKFLNSRVGAGLRKVISKGKHLRRLVNFSAYQVFSEVTTYTCLLFLSNAPNAQISIDAYCGKVEGAERPPQPLADSNAWRSSIEISPAGHDDWNLGVAGASLFSKWKKFQKLSSVARIFQGTGTRADDVFVVEKRGKKTYFSRELQCVVKLEDRLLRPVVRGRGIKRYERPSDENCLLCPYVLNKEKYRLITESELRRSSPLAASYLRNCKPRLLKREDGRFSGDVWFAFGRPQNMEKLDQFPKILMPDVAARGECTLDQSGFWAIDTAYGILPTIRTLKLKALLGVLNSTLLTFYLKQVGTPLRGGYFRMKTAYLSPFPIADGVLNNSAKLIAAVDAMLVLHASLSKEQSPHRREQLQREIDATDRRIDRLVYELYELTPDEIALIESSTQ